MATRKPVCCPTDEYALGHLENVLRGQEDFNRTMKAMVGVLYDTSQGLKGHSPAAAEREELAAVVYKALSHLGDRITEQLGVWGIRYLQEAAGASEDLADYLLARVAKRAAQVELQDAIGEAILHALRPERTAEEDLKA